jgi:SP family arabinose:H+ symporter-like MFS transporter
MPSRLFFWSLVSALAGFLFGFDTVVISGAEQKIQSLWNLSGHMHGLAMAAALYGTVLGSLIGAWPTDRWGRKRTLIWIGVLYFVSAVWSGLAPDVWSLIIARFIGGLGVGISTITAPLYISEISPPERRGRLTGMFQFNIVFGILVAFLSNWLLGKTGENSWRWMLGVEALPALIYTLLCFRLPESPRWLIARGRREEGEQVLRLIAPESPPAEIARTADNIAAASQHQPSEAGTGFWSRRLRVPIFLAFLIAAFNQLSGINVILYFAPRLLGLAGIGNPLLASVCIGFVNLIFTFVGLWLIDRLGRKTLLTIGSFGYIVSLGVCAWAFLSFGEFRIVSKSIDLAEAAGRLAKIEAGELKLLPQDVTDAREAYDKALAVYAATTASLPDAAIPSGAAPAAVKEAAEKTKAAAAEALGGRSLIVLICLLLFIAAHAIGQGAVIWVFISEIFPNRYRAPGQSLGSATHWVFAAALTQLFPIAIARFEAGWHFAFFCGMMVLQLLWVKLMVVETKGVPLEEVQRKLLGTE